jgi:amino acid transporter
VLTERERVSRPTRLRRSLSTWQVVTLTIALVAPTVSVILVGPVAFTVGGTSAIDAVLLVGVSVISTGLCLAELGSMFPSAGGVIALAKKILPGPFTWFTVLAALMIGVAGAALLAVGMPPFVKDVLPLQMVPNNIIAVVMICLGASIALIRVKLGAAITAAMIVVESVALGSIIAAAVVHHYRSVASIVLHPVNLEHGSLVPASFTDVVMLVPLAFAIITAYEAGLGYAEELTGGSRALGKAMVWATVLSVIVIAVPLIASVVAAPSLKDFLATNQNPIILTVQQTFGIWFGKVIAGCVVLALFTTMVSGFMYCSRFVYATGRDKFWTPAVNHRLSRLNRHAVPATAVLWLTALAIPLAFVAVLSWLVMLSATLMACVYCAVGLAALWARYKFKYVRRPFRMWLWPVPPLIVIVVTVYTVAKQATDLVVIAVVLLTIATVLHIWQRRADKSRLPNASGLYICPFPETLKLGRRPGGASSCARMLFASESDPRLIFFLISA